jgi:hypothetical protein
MAIAEWNLLRPQGAPWQNSRMAVHLHVYASKLKKSHKVIPKRAALTLKNSRAR